jgi:long-chain acyl-CoA synthetase
MELTLFHNISLGTRMGADELRFEADFANEIAYCPWESWTLRARFEEKSIAPCRVDHATNAIRCVDQKDLRAQLLEAVSTGQACESPADNNRLLMEWHCARILSEVSKMPSSIPESTVQDTKRTDAPQAQPNTGGARTGRRSLVEFMREYEARRNEIAVAQRRGYRMERWTYGQILDGANRFARELEARGIVKGEAVLLWGPGSAEWTAAFLGCMLRGAVAVPIDAVSTAEFAARVALDVNAKLIVRSERLACRESPAPSLSLETFSVSVANHSAVPYPSPALTRNDTLETIFTSGTTAEPRGVVISHGNVLANIEPLEKEIQKYLRWERFFHPLRFLNLLPLSHIFGQMMSVFIPPLLGATVIHVDSLKPWETIDTIRRERVSVLVTVPRLIESLEREIERDLESRSQLETFRKHFDASEGHHFLRRWWTFRAIHRRFGWKFWAFICGGAALPEQTETFWHRLGYAVVQGYGMTETTSLITLNHPFRTGRGSIGSAFPGMEIKVDAKGEVLVRGENVATAYRRGQELEPVAGSDGWFHTGDLAEVGADGRLYFKGRSKNTIVTSAGMKVYPEDLEKALRKQEGVRDCVVIGLERSGNEEPCAALLLDSDNGDGARAVEQANKSLADYQQVRQWFVWPAPDFPRTATQKPALAAIRAVVEVKLSGAGAPKRTASVSDLVAQITRRLAHSGSTEDGGEDLANMSSLDRVELMSAIEDRYQVDLSEARFSQANSVAELEKLIREPQPAPVDYTFPHWPQSWPIKAIRLAAYYLLVRPATYLLAAPRIRGKENLRGVQGPVLVVSNHVTYVDIGWILAALPVRLRHRLATAMRGERLAQMRHPDPKLGWLERFAEWISYPLVLTFFNVFPLPKESGFLRSFSFVGNLIDRRWSVLVFPEGLTTPDGKLAPFRSGIGLLATRLNIPIVPIRLDGLFDLKEKSRSFARPGHVKVTIGKPVRFSSEQHPEEIAKDLQHRIEEL